jgi:hypothetical protein
MAMYQPPFFYHKSPKEKLTEKKKKESMWNVEVRIF